MANKTKYAVTALAASAVFFIGLAKHEGFCSKPYKDSGGVPTIGIGSTQYPNGKRVTMADKPITKEEAIEITKHHVARDEGRLKASLPNVKLSQAEYDVYLDFVYQYGQATFDRSSIRRELLKGNHKAACRNLLKYKYVGKRDCSIRKNGCYGVWTRQLERYRLCMGANK